jgi:hypothetical protein
MLQKKNAIIMTIEWTLECDEWEVCDECTKKLDIKKKRGT